MQKIVIKNFNQITNAEIELSKFVCLIGEQASGKSTIAKLIYFFKSLKVEFLKLFFEKNEATNPELKKAFIDAIICKFSIYFGSVNQLHADFCIEYYVSIEQSHYIRLSKGPNGSLKITFSQKYWVLFTAQASTLRNQLHQSTRQQKFSSYLLQTRTKQDLIHKINRFANNLFFDQQDMLFFPAGRSILSALGNKLYKHLEEIALLDTASVGGDHTNYPVFKRRSTDFNLIMEYIGYTRTLVNDFIGFDAKEDISIPYIFKKYMGQILKGSYMNEDGKERIYYDETHFIPLNLASSGQQDVINIMLDAISIYRNKLQASRIIEEPETHLFPSSQRHLVEFLVAMSNCMDCSYIITTHSPFVLAALNNILYLNQVICEHPESIDKMIDIFGASEYGDKLADYLHLTAKDFRAYNLNPFGRVAYCQTMVDSKTGLIGSNLIDNSSESIYGIFDKIYDIDNE